MAGGLKGSASRIKFLHYDGVMKEEGVWGVGRHLKPDIKRKLTVSVHHVLLGVEERKIRNES